MKRLAILLLALALPGLAAAADYTVQSGSSTLGFSSTFQGETFQGHFEKWNAAIRYDPANLAASKFDVTVHTASVQTGDSDRDSALPGEAFFDVAKYPEAHFVTTGFRKSGNQVIADGTLTLRGVSKPVSLQVAFAPQQMMFGAFADPATLPPSWRGFGGLPATSPAKRAHATRSASR